MSLRRLILETAAATTGVGKIEETLKWGQPSYVTSETQSGTTIRIDWRKSTEEEYAIYFHCQTRLAETFRTLFPNDFRFEGNRTLIFSTREALPTDALRYCIEAALTYHMKPRSKRGSPARRHAR